MTMVSSSVRRQHPLHPASQVAVTMSSNQQMKVVWHQTIAQDVDRQTTLGIHYGLDERVIIRRLVENGVSPVATIQHVVPRVSHRCSRGSGHPSSVTSFSQTEQ